MKVLRNILAVLSAVSFLITILMPFISSKMQDYYKSLSLDEWSQEILDKKLFWSQLGETYVFLYASVICTCAFLIVALVMYLRNRSNDVLP